MDFTKFIYNAHESRYIEPHENYDTFTAHLFSSENIQAKEEKHGDISCSADFNNACRPAKAPTGQRIIGV